MTAANESQLGLL